MITALRSVLKSHAYRIFLWIFLAVLIFGGISFDFSDNRPWVIKVYKQKKNELEYRQAVSNLQKQYDYLKAQGINWPRTETVEREVLRHMVSSSLMHQIADQLGLVAPEILVQEQLAGQLAGLPDYFFDENGNLHIQLLEKVIAPKTFDSFLQELENEVKLNLLNNLISLGSYTSAFEVDMELVQEYADKDYSVMKFSLAKALEQVKENPVSNEVLEQFYKKSENADGYKLPEKRAGRYWKFSCKNYGLSVSKSEISEYYDKHKQNDYLETPAQVQVYRIFFAEEQESDFSGKQLAQTTHEELMKDPAAFADVAKKIAGAKLKSQGSEKTEFFAKDSDKYDKILVDTAFEQLSEDKAISQVIKTQNGYEIIQRLGRKAAKYKSLHEVQSQIEEKLLDEKFAKRFKQDAQRVISSARYNPEGLENFIEKRHGHKETIGLEPRKMDLISMQLFQTEEGQYNVFMMGKEGIVLECTQIQKRILPPLHDIKSKVQEDYYKKQAEKQLHNTAMQAVKNLTEKDFVSVAHELSAHTQTAYAQYKNNQMEFSEILKNPEIAQKLKTLQNAGDVVEVTTATESFIIRLDKVAPIDEKLFAEKEVTVKNNLVNKGKYKGKESFIACLYRYAKLVNKIEVKEQLLKDAKDTIL
ncbi:MAG: peptidylprolyl isomerase [Candidatus Chromulinivorax sp.]